MEAGKLRHLVQLQANTPTQNTLGEPSDSWATIANIYAAIRPMAGQASHQITVRNYPGLSAENRIKFGTRIFDINSVNNVDERNREMILLCSELS
jgi:head-tail adaptor